MALTGDKEEDKFGLDLGGNDILGSIKPPSLFLYFKVALLTLVPLHFYVNLRINMSMTTKKKTFLVF